MPDHSAATESAVAPEAGAAAAVAPRLLIISPTKDEALFLQRTIDSMVRQSVI